MERILLNDGCRIPAIGFGTYQIPADGSTVQAVKTALSLGIRHIDTAAVYRNEHEVGQAVAESGVPRQELWLTSKLWVQDFHYEDAKKAIDRSLRKLRTDYLDLYLIHQPFGPVAEAWQALEEAKREGKLRSIGVSNMTAAIWNRYVPNFSTLPSVNQIEFNPYCQQRQVRSLMIQTGTALESWGPLGQGNTVLLSDPLITSLAEKYGKNAGQIILRFENQEGAIIFPKSVRAERIKSNMEIFDFALTTEEMAAIRTLDTGKGVFDPDAPGVGDFLLSAFDIHDEDD